jgi:hypothetical protein
MAAKGATIYTYRAKDSADETRGRLSGAKKVCQQAKGTWAVTKPPKGTKPKGGPKKK